MQELARDPRQFGSIVRNARKSQGISQQRLADLTGLTQATISLLESGSSKVRMDTLLAVLAALNLELRVTPRSQGWDY